MTHKHCAYHYLKTMADIGCCRVEIKIVEILTRIA